MVIKKRANQTITKQINFLFFKPWLLLPSQFLHNLSPYLLKIYSLFFSCPTYQWRSFHWKGLYFSNPLGIAGGIDKNAMHIQNWQKLGVGFCEVGTITPEPQQANPKPILDRSLQHLSLWNNMGFPNKGLKFAVSKLKQTTKKQPLFINIGKNRETPLEQSVKDYKKALIGLQPFADAFIINISSPNTKSLRALSQPQYLKPFLKALQEHSQNIKSQTEQKIPMILKLSPDEPLENFIFIIEESIKADIDGWCICNSSSKRLVPHLFPDYGGVSGKLLKDQSLKALKNLKSYLDKNKIQDKLIISCGGVLTAEDVQERLQHGANLVQVYSALVFKGPSFFKKTLKKLM